MKKQIYFNLTKFQPFLEKFTILGEKELCLIIGGGLSNDLLDYRIKFALTQEQLAKEIGVSRQALSKWELGTSLPKADKLKIITKILQFNTSTIIH